MKYILNGVNYNLILILFSEFMRYLFDEMSLLISDLLFSVVVAIRY